MATTQVTQRQILDGTIVIADLSATGTPGATTFLRGDNTWAAPTKADVGLGNVDNTSDATKNAATATLLGKTLTAPVFSAGTASAASQPKLTAGTNLTTVEAGAIEFDGAGKYFTNDTTTGRQLTTNRSLFRLTADGTAISVASDIFGANSSFPYVANSFYLITWRITLLKTTAGAATFAIWPSTTLNYSDFNLIHTNIAGVGLNTANIAGLVGATASTGTPFPATGSLATGVNHQFLISGIFETATTGNLRLKVTPGAGTITPKRGSYYTVQRIPSANVGIFVA